MRRPIVLLLAVFATLGIAGCSPRPAATPQTISFMVFGEPAERDAYQSLVDAFHEANADVRVELTHIPSQGDYRQRLAADFAAGEPQDVTLINYRRFAGFAADQLEPLGPYLDRSEVLNPEDFYPVALDVFRWKGTVTCIPQNMSSLVVYYNEALFDAAGVPYPADDWTWDDFLQAAIALTQDTTGDGQMDQYGLGVEASVFRAAPFIWQNAGELVDDTARPSRLVLTRPPALEALRWFTELRTVHGVVPTREEEASLDSESRFVGGTTAMFLNSRRGVPSYREIEGFGWDVAPLPRGLQTASVLHADAFCLSRAAPNKEAAWRFIEFANSEEGQTLLAASGRTVPSLRAVAESDAFLEADARPSRSRVFLDSIPSLRAVPVISTWNEIEEVATEEVERAFYGDISVDEAARLAVQRTEEYFLTGESAGE